MLGRLIEGAARKLGSHSPSSDSALSVLGLPPTKAGVDITEITALNISAVWCAVTIIGNSFAGLPVFVYRRSGPGEKEADRDNPVFDLLHRRPNPTMTPSRFKKILMQWTLLWGNGRAEIERNDNGDPIALWPIHPSRSWSWLDDDGKKWHTVNVGSAGPVDIPDADVLHMHGLSLDGINGISVIGAARNSLGLTVAAEEYGAVFFANNARPSGTLNMLGELKDVEATRKKFADIFANEGRHGMVILEEGMEFKPMSVPNEDAQFLQTRQFQTVEIARWWNIPPHMLKDLERATFSNIEHQAIDYVGHSIMPYAIDFEEECDRKFFPNEPDMFCEMMIDAILRADSKTRNEVLHIKRQDGIINADEWRAKENENPQPDGQGKVYFINSTMKPVDVQLNPPAPPPMLPAPPANEPPPNDDQEQVRAGIAEAHWPLMYDAFSRMARVASNAARRAMKKPDTLGSWCEKFLDGHATAAHDAIAPVIESLMRSLDATHRIIAGPALDDAVTDQITTAAGTYGLWCKAMLAGVVGGNEPGDRLGMAEGMARDAVKYAVRAVDKLHAAQTLGVESCN